jgi:hypothetical protein
MIPTIAHPAGASLRGGAARLSPDARWVIDANGDGAWLGEVRGLSSH